MSRANQWFVPGEGIAREVITADIQRYLGPDALVKPGNGTGEHDGRPGYWITAYRTLTSQMIQDLKMDSQRWQAEQENRTGRGVAYQDSRTHAARQHWGPSETFAGGGAARQEQQPARTTQTAPTHYATTEQQHYTTTPAASAYGSYPAAQSAYTQPRTQPAVDSYAGYGQTGREHPGYATAQYASSAYSQPAAQDPYRSQPPPPAHVYAAPSPVAAPGYYIASDGRQYPLAQQPPSNGRRR